MSQVRSTGSSTTSRSSSSRSSSSSRTRSGSRTGSSSRNSSSSRTSSSSRARPQDRARVSGEARRADGNNPVNFGAWAGNTLQQGSRGQDVSSLQKQLNAQGANLKVDGVFGKDTLAAVKKFQGDRQLKADGLAGPKTMQALGGTQHNSTQRDQAQAAQASQGQPQQQQSQAPAAQTNQAQRAEQTQAIQPSADGSAFGRRLASDANQIARSGVAGKGRNCKRGVRMALNRQGIQLHGVSAYMAAGQLARNDRFREAKMGRQDLRNLPPGAIVVWNKGQGRPHGHISVALGNGKEASDVLRNQITNYPTNFRVFLPK